MVSAYRPESIEKALKYIADEECIIFAGGTDLMVKYRQWAGIEPKLPRPVVFISDIDELKEIKREGGKIRIGSAATCSDIYKSDIIPKYFKDTVSSMASPAVRNGATIGGNICNSSPAGDIIPLLYALNAVVHIRSIDGSRDVNIQDFITGPGRNVLKKHEMVECITVPDESFEIQYIKKVGTRNANGLSKLSFAGLAKKCNDSITDVRIAFGAVGPKVVRDKEIEDEIIKVKGSVDIKKLAGLYRQEIEPISDQRSTELYRREVCIRLTEDFLKCIFV